MYAQGGCSLQPSFLAAENWTQSKHPSGGEWMNNLYNLWPRSTWRELKKLGKKKIKLLSNIFSVLADV